jgi:hypothetical protein
MPNYVVEIKETLALNVLIDADNKQDALNIAEERYKKEEIVLHPEDFQAVDFNIIK